MEGHIPSMEDIQAQQQQAADIAAYEERKAMILDQILEPAAKERLSRLAIVKKDRVRSVESSLIQAAQNGRLKSKVSEEQLIVMLEQTFGPEDGEEEGIATKKKGVTIQRKKYGMEDDDDDDDDDDFS